MPGYDNAKSCTYNFPEMDFSGITEFVHYIAGPAGKVGRLLEIGVVITVATVFPVTLGKMMLGHATDADHYALLNIATGVAAKATFNSKNDTDAIILADIPADTSLFVDLIVGGADGTLAGKGYPYLIIEWY